jgi:hypothetical protein
MVVAANPLRAKSCCTAAKLPREHRHTKWACAARRGESYRRLDLTVNPIPFHSHVSIPCNCNRNRSRYG